MNDFNKSPQKLPPRPVGPAFSILAAVKAGYQFALVHKKIMFSLSLLPLLAMLATSYVVNEVFKDSPFYTIIAYIPANFILGLTCCIVVRLMFAHLCNRAVERRSQDLNSPHPYEIEGAPAQDKVKAFALKDRFYKPGDVFVWLMPLLPAVVAFTFISYLLDGMMLLFQLIFYYHIGNNNLETAQIFALDQTHFVMLIPESYAPAILIFMLGFMMWFMRYMWLPVIITLKKPIKSTYDKMGNLETSMAISFCLLLIYVSVLILFALVMSIIFPFVSTNGEEINQGVATLAAIVNSLALIIAFFIFMAASTHAVFELEKRRLGR
jgi:hypothetical protein